MPKYALRVIVNHKTREVSPTVEDDGCGIGSKNRLANYMLYASRRLDKIARGEQKDNFMRPFWEAMVAHPEWVEDYIFAWFDATDLNEARNAARDARKRLKDAYDLLGYRAMLSAPTPPSSG